MKILIITPQYPPQLGGIASFVYNLAEHWPNNNEIIIYTAKMKGGVEFDARTNWKVIRKKLGIIRILWQIWRLNKREPINLIQLHQPSLLGRAVYLAQKLFKIPYRVCLHSADFNYLKTNPRQRKKIEKICKLAKQIVVNSEYLQREYGKYFEESKKEPLIVYPCPSDCFFTQIETSEIKDLKSHLALEGKRVILTVASMTEGKGYPHLVHLLPDVLSQSPNLAWLIIGDGPKKESFLELMQKNNLQNIIRFIGRVPHERLLPYYKLADLFILLLHPDQEAEEGWATVLLEAAAAGLPVMAGQVGGIEEAVQHLKTGLIVDINQEQAVTNGLVELLRNQKYAKQMGQAGREWVKENFNWDKEVKKLL